MLSPLFIAVVVLHDDTRLVPFSFDCPSLCDSDTVRNHVHHSHWSWIVRRFQYVRLHGGRGEFECLYCVHCATIVVVIKYLRNYLYLLLLLSICGKGGAEIGV